MPEIIRVQPNHIKPTADYPINEQVLAVLENKIGTREWQHIEPVPLVRAGQHGQELLSREAHEVVAVAFLHNISVPAVMQEVDKRVMEELLAQRAKAVARGYHTIQDWLVHTLGPERYMDKMRILHL